MIAQWDSSLSVLPVARVQFPATSISRDFSLADRTLPTRPEPVWQKMAQSPLKDTTQPVDSEEEGRSSTRKNMFYIQFIVSKDGEEKQTQRHDEMSHQHNGYLVIWYPMPYKRFSFKLKLG